MVAILENPLRVGLQQERTAEPLIMVIFGASGDLTQRKLGPAIYQLKQERRLAPETTIVGVARRDWSHDYFREQLRQGIEEFGGGIGNEEFWKSFAEFTSILIAWTDSIICKKSKHPFQVSLIAPYRFHPICIGMIDPYHWNPVKFDVKKITNNK